MANYRNSLSDLNNHSVRGDKDCVCRIISDNNINRYAIHHIFPTPISKSLFIPLIVLIVAPTVILRLENESA